MPFVMDKSMPKQKAPVSMLFSVLTEVLLDTYDLPSVQNKQ